MTDQIMRAILFDSATAAFCSPFVSFNCLAQTSGLSERFLQRVIADSAPCTNNERT